MQSHIYQIETEIGCITVSKKEYLYQKERVINELCPEDEIRINGSLKQCSIWKEETLKYPKETITTGYKQLIRYGTIEKPVIYSKFEQSLIDNKNDIRKISDLIYDFLKNI